MRRRRRRYTAIAEKKWPLLHLILSPHWEVHARAVKRNGAARRGEGWLATLDPALSAAIQAFSAVP